MVELLVATGAASVLMVGLISALAISVRCFQVHPTKRKIELSQSTHDLARLAESAKHLPAQSASLIEMRVPDQDADQVDETISIGFSGVAGSNVSLSRNGGTEVPLITSVSAFSSQVYSTTLPSPTLPTLEQVKFVGFSESKVGGDESITVAQPSGCEAGNLLVLIVATHGDRKESLSAGAWNEIDVRNRSHVTLGIWWRIAATATGNHTAVWSDNEDAYATILAFSGQDSGFPVGATSFRDGHDNNPIIRSIETTVDESMVLCVGAFHNDDIFTDNCGVASAYSVTMDHSNEKISVGAAIAPAPLAGTFLGRSFELSSAEDYITASIVINAQ